MKYILRFFAAIGTLIFLASYILSVTMLFIIVLVVDLFGLIRKLFNREKQNADNDETEGTTT